MQTAAGSETVDWFDPEADPTVNHVELIGYVGNTPEVRYAASHEPVIRFSLATRSWHDDGNGPVEATDWHQVVAAGKSAEACRRVLPGMLLQVHGRLHTRSWVDRRHVHHSSTEIIVDRVQTARRPARQQWLPLEVPA